MSKKKKLKKLKKWKEEWGDMFIDPRYNECSHLGPFQIDGTDVLLFIFGRQIDPPRFYLVGCWNGDLLCSIRLDKAEYFCKPRYKLSKKEIKDLDKYLSSKSKYDNNISNWDSIYSDWNHSIYNIPFNGKKPDYTKLKEK